MPACGGRCPRTYTPIKDPDEGIRDRRGDIESQAGEKPQSHINIPHEIGTTDPLHKRGIIYTPAPPKERQRIDTPVPVDGPGILINIDFPDPLGQGKRSNIFESRGIESEQPGDYINGKAPNQVEPGTIILNGQYVDDDGNIMPWTAHYDEYGRLKARTDYDDPDSSKPNPHHHVYEWGPGRAPKEVGSHVPGEYEP